MIVKSAIKFSNGEVIPSLHHWQAHKIASKLGIKEKCTEGYIDHTGKFYNQEEAKKIAIENNQLPKDFNKELESDDLWSGSSPTF